MKSWRKPNMGSYIPFFKCVNVVQWLIYKVPEHDLTHNGSCRFYLNNLQSAYEKGMQLCLVTVTEVTVVRYHVPSEKIGFYVLSRNKDSSDFIVQECTFRHRKMLTFVSVT